MYKLSTQRTAGSCTYEQSAVFLWWKENSV